MNPNVQAMNNSPPQILPAIMGVNRGFLEWDLWLSEKSFYNCMAKRTLAVNLVQNCPGTLPHGYAKHHPA